MSRLMSDLSSETYVVNPDTPGSTHRKPRGRRGFLAFSGAMAQSPSDASAAEMASGDLETGRLLGERVAEIAARFAR